MPDEVVTGEAPEQEQQGQQQEQVIEQPKVDPYEDKARATGWRPLEEFEGDPETWVDAKEFLGRAPLFDKIKHQTKKQKELEKAHSDAPPCGYTPPTRFRKGYGEKGQAVVQRHLREMRG